MKKIFIIISAALTASLLFSSCKKVLIKNDLQNSTAAQVYNDSLTTKFSMDYTYSQNQPGWFGNSGGYIGSIGPYNVTEECYSDNPVVKGTVTIETVGDIGTSSAATNAYGKLRGINSFIRDVNAGTLDAPVKKRFIAQALFWRAYRYFELVKIYGGVPIVLTPLDEVGTGAKTAAQLSRNTTTQTFTQIVADLDTAIKYLPGKWPQPADYGHITSGAAAAFLGRVLLTWASPEFNANNDVTRWQAAYTANTNAISILSKNGFGLYSKWDYTMWTTESGNPESVLVTEYNTDQTSNGQNNNGYTASAMPKYLATGSGSFQPTWDIVKAFPMADGKAAGASKYTYSDLLFFDNRDPRFYQTIAYNGCLWPLLGNSTYRLWTYNYYSNTAGTSSKSTESSSTNSGFYLRKAVDPTISTTLLPYSGTDWIEIRYAEVLLNQAEAAAEIGNLGQSQEAYTNLIAIRKRAGIEAGTNGLYGLTAGMGHDAMINAIMFERQIEFAYEGKRYWDLRRRKLLETTLNNKMRQGISIFLKNTGLSTDYILTTRDASASTAAGLDNLYTSSFTVNVKNLDTYKIAIQTADYFFGIPTAALQNNPNLQQNNTWGGPFDPLN
ncbi:RagB/SusD family nutrient uptake outer membrane protein [Mucilaginibacter sp.]|uniref:RagB/SusD family nutrient uptake outer membrane protein n=1 Tax=Mucilaginibacter sp. TaxID=1882438 RepID=UPI002637563D|nr:RagB/SusD family nutrient uptake outer membrane protein [Mucilaginibacter sp.]